MCDEIFYDQYDNQISLKDLVKINPDWAVETIRELKKNWLESLDEVLQLQQEVARLEDRLDNYCYECNCDSSWED